MPNMKEFDARMTVNLQSAKKKQLQAIAEEKRVSDSTLLLRAVDEWLERHGHNGYGDSADSS